MIIIFMEDSMVFTPENDGFCGALIKGQTTRSFRPVIPTFHTAIRKYSIVQKSSVYHDSWKLSWILIKCHLKISEKYEKLRETYTENVLENMYIFSIRFSKNHFYFYFYWAIYEP